MATSPNFSWPEPDNTDLVKNGALAIRTAVDAIDTSMAELKGGTTGQVLSKTSNTDMDFTWVAQDDSNAIQNALLTTTGDTIYASSASTPARRAIGTTGQVLTVSGGVPVWATPSSGSLTSQSANLASNVTMSSANTYYDSVSISLAAGTWYIVAQTSIEDGGGNGGRKTAKLWDGTTVTSSLDSTQPTGGTIGMTLSGIVVPTTTTTYKVSVAGSQPSQTILATATTNGAGANVSHISAIKIA
jgi:hypothetical protein